MTIDDQIAAALEGVPPEKHRETLLRLLNDWGMKAKAGSIPPGTYFAAMCLIENMVERLPTAGRKPRARRAPGRRSGVCR